MHVQSNQPLGPRQPGRTEPTRPGQTPAPADPGRGPVRRDVYQGTPERPAPSAGPDRLDLSPAGRDLGRDLLPGPRGPETPEERAARVLALAQELAEGRLFSAERLERAATRLLGGE